MNISSGVLVKSVIEKNIMEIVENDSNIIPQYNDEYDERFLAHIDEIESELSNPGNIIKFKNSDDAINYLKKKCI